MLLIRVRGEASELGEQWKGKEGEEKRVQVHLLLSDDISSFYYNSKLELQQCNCMLPPTSEAVVYIYIYILYYALVHVDVCAKFALGISEINSGIDKNGAYMRSQ